MSGLLTLVSHNTNLLRVAAELGFDTLDPMAVSLMSDGESSGWFAPNAFDAEVAKAESVARTAQAWV